jgi:hypothetical protein
MCQSRLAGKEGLMDMYFAFLGGLIIGAALDRLRVWYCLLKIRNEVMRN